MKRGAGMVIIGITGGIGTGKTTVAKMFETLGAEIIDADRIARSIVSPGTEAWGKIISAFGKEILNEDGKINRRKLAGIVFMEKPEKLAELNSITHPGIINIILERINDAKAKGIEVVVIDAPLLIETGMEEVIGRLVVVTAGRQQQEARSKFTPEETGARMHFQMPPEEKGKKADYIVDNDGTFENTLKQVEKIWEEVG